MAKTNRPIYSLKAGALNLSVWENETKKGIMQSITLNRTYKDGEDFKKTTSFRANDLPLIETLIRKAMEYLYLKDSDEVLKPGIGYCNTVEGKEINNDETSSF